MAAQKKKFHIRFDWSVVAELDALLREHPELPYKSTADAAQHAIYRFTKDLKKELGLIPQEARDLPPMNELLSFIERFYKEQRGKDKKKS